MTTKRERIPAWRRCWNLKCGRPAKDGDIWCKPHRKVEDAKTGHSLEKPTRKEARNG
jgi:hypothetical protein